MSNRARSNDEETRRLVVAITDFLRDQLATRTDLDPEDTDCLEIAIQSLELAYGLDPHGYVQLRFRRPLLDIFTQVTDPVPVKDKLRADSLKDEGNALLRMRMAQEAETSYSNAIDLDRWNSIYYCNRASARIAQQHYFEAISDCRQALTLNPDYAKAHAKMGQSYALLHRPREAARCFRQAVNLEPNNERYRTNLGVAESQIQRPDAMSFLTDFLNSFFGRNGSGNTGVASLPASFMIITESHPSRHNVQPTEELNTNMTTETHEPGTQTHDDLQPLRYGIVDEGSEEQAVVQTNVDDKTTTIGEHSHEFIFQFPLFGIIEDDEVNNSQRLLLSSETEAQEHETRDERLKTFNSHNFGINPVSYEQDNNKNEVSSEQESIQSAQLKGSSDSTKTVPFPNVIPSQIPNYDSERNHIDTDTSASATKSNLSSQDDINKTQSEYIDELIEVDKRDESLGSPVNLTAGKESINNFVPDDSKENVDKLDKSIHSENKEGKENKSQTTIENIESDSLKENDKNLAAGKESISNFVLNNSKENVDKLDKSIHSENKEGKENKSQTTTENIESDNLKEKDKNKSKEKNNSSEKDNPN